jgi:hypothetical protein
MVRICNLGGSYFDSGIHNVAEESAWLLQQTVYDVDSDALGISEGKTGTVETSVS